MAYNPRGKDPSRFTDGLHIVKDFITIEPPQCQYIDCCSTEVEEEAQSIYKGIAADRRFYCKKCLRHFMQSLSIAEDGSVKLITTFMDYKKDQVLDPTPFDNESKKFA